VGRAGFFARFHMEYRLPLLVTDNKVAQLALATGVLSGIPVNVVFVFIVGVSWRFALCRLLVVEQPFRRGYFHQVRGQECWQSRNHSHS
jgi:hypothetical protein